MILESLTLVFRVCRVCTLHTVHAGVRERVHNLFRCARTHALVMPLVKPKLISPCTLNSRKSSETNEHAHLPLPSATD